MQKFNRKYLIAVLLMLVTLSLYWPALSHEFINYDDPEYVTGNVHVKAGLTSDNMRWAFTSTLMGNWNPVTWISHMADSEIYGMDPRGHHLTNIVLHGFNTVLLFILLNTLTGALWRSAFAAAFFSFHPLRVESVAWVAERKDVLSAFFFMTTLLAYVSYVRSPSIRRYLLIMLLFVLGLMSKPMLVTLPFVLILLDYWPLGRLHPGGQDFQTTVSALAEDPPSATPSTVRLVSEKIPLFITSGFFAVIAVYAQSSAKAIRYVPEYPVAGRIANALISYVTYLEKTFWPQDLAILYPLREQVPLFYAVAAFVFLAVISLLFLRLAKRSPFLIVGWLWFIGTLVPVIGFIQVGLQAMADRYTYIPSIGLSLLVVWGIAEIAAASRYRAKILAVSGLVACLLLMGATRLQLRYWENSETLFSHTLAVTKRNYIAHANLGDALDKQGRLSEAMYHYEEALRIKPDEAFVYSKMANDLDRIGKLEDAARYYRKSLQLDPDNARVHSNFGVLLTEQGRTEEAKQHFFQAVRLDPTLRDAHYNLGLALASEGRIQEAIYHYSRALELSPSDPEIRDTLQRALAEESAHKGK